MKPLSVIISLLFLSLLTGCEAESVPSIQESTAGHILSRSNDTELLPAESQILLNAHGGMTIENQAFKFDGNTWSDGNEYKWEDTQKPTYITALYPLFENKQYTAANLYDESGLKDILIAQDTISENTGVELTFKHLFASFTLKVEESLADDIQAISLTIPKSVESISPTTGKITSSDIPSSTTLAGNGNCCYTFIIPPMVASLTLDITLKDNSDIHPYKLNNHTFESGIKYECTLRNGKTIPGIRTAEDLIAFSLLINKKSYGTYKLSDFGEKQSNGKMLYRLLNNIDLKDVNTQDLLPIGYYNGPSVIFSDIFDGLGHTISNLTIPDKSVNENIYKNYSGLFGHIGPEGIVRNLHIANATTASTTTCTYIGGLAAKNEGIIQNCSVKDSKLKYSNSSTETGIRIGGICASMTNGYIINTHSTNNTIETERLGAIGGIIGESCGHIINCYTYSNTFAASNGAYAGGIVGRVSTTNKLNIANSYVLHFKAPKNWGAIIGLLQEDMVDYDNIFYNGGTLIYENNSNNNFEIYQYQQFSYNEKHISTYLNEWIKTTGNNYPNFTFYEWDKSTISPFPAIFK